MKKSLMLLIGLLLCGLIAAQPAAWQEEQHPNDVGSFYTNANYPDSLFRIATATQLNEANGSDFFTSQPYDAEYLVEALSIMWVDLDEIAGQSVSLEGYPIIWGHEAYTEDGERSFAVTLQNHHDEVQVAVLLAERASFDQLGGFGFLFLQDVATVQTPVKAEKVEQSSDTNETNESKETITNENSASVSTDNVNNENDAIENTTTENDNLTTEQSNQTTQQQASNPVSTPSSSIVEAPAPFAAASKINATLEDLGLAGRITLDEYDWFAVESHLGVIQIDLAAGTKRRLADGRYPWMHLSGDVIFSQGCGDDVQRIMLRDISGLPVAITPCSNVVPNNSLSDETSFVFSRLSPDKTKIAVEVRAYEDWDFRYWTVVFDRDANLIATFDEQIAPAWLPDGRLLLGGEGLFITDINLSNLERLDGGRLTSLVNNIAVDASGNRIVFEYNQQIFYINTDGSGLKEYIYGGSNFRYPAWSPDGTMLVYLATSDQDYYDKALYFTNITTGQSYAVDLTEILDSTDPSRTVNGPLSWY